MGTIADVERVEESGGRVNQLVKAIFRPARGQTLTGAVLDLSRSKLDLIAENALLRHQLVLLKRSIKCPTLKPKDRLCLLLLAKVTRTWRQVLFIVQSAALLRWYREGFRLFWRLKSKPCQRQPRLSTETIGLIRQMANENPLWDAERIRGELLKLGIHVSKQTVQRYRDPQPRPGQSGQIWSTFLKTHVKDI